MKIISRDRYQIAPRLRSLARPRVALHRPLARRPRAAHWNLALLLSLLVALTVGTLACGNDDEFGRPSGTLEATEVDLAPLLTARVLEVRAAEGDRIAKGDTLLILDTELLRRQRAQTAAREGVVEAQKGEAEQLLKQSRSRLELAETTLRRTSALREQGSATQQQVDELRAERDIASSQIDVVRNRIVAFGAQQTEIERGLAVIDRQIADGTVLSPISGTVLLRAAEPGELGRTGGLALRIADLDTLDLRVYLEETDLDLVRIGQQLPVFVDALEGKGIPGVVRWISEEAEFTPKNAQTRKARAQLVYAIKLSVPNPDGRLHIGMPATVRID